MVVLPTPRTPVIIKAWAIRSAAKALVNVRTIASWPIKSSKRCGRYLRAKTKYAADLLIAVGLAFSGASSNIENVLSSRPSSDTSALTPGRSSSPLRPSWFMWGHSKAIQSQKRWRPNSDPKRNSLWLLPSGPDQIGEDYVHRRSPSSISQDRASVSSGNNGGYSIDGRQQAFALDQLAHEGSFQPAI